MSYAILVVADNAGNLKLLRDVLDHAGYIEKRFSICDLRDEIRRLLSSERGCAQ